MRIRILRPLQQSGDGLIASHVTTREALVVVTSNIGAADLLNLQHSTFATMERHVLTRAQQSLRPELFARVTEKLVFNRLSYDHQLEIANLLLSNEIKFLESRGHVLEPDKSVLPFLVQRGFHPKLGARPMRDAIEKLVGDAVATDILAGGNGAGSLSVSDTGNFLLVLGSRPHSSP